MIALLEDSAVVQRLQRHLGPPTEISVVTHQQTREGDNIAGA